jgi:uracil-DNA glycosylase family 4
MRWFCGGRSDVARRDDMLRELGLAPSWRMRARVAAPIAPIAAVVAEAIVDGTAAAVTGEVIVETPGITAGDRLAFIARLNWPDIASDVTACTACGLCKTRNRAVPGVGDVHAEWMFVGEAPGAEEDARGEPFVGQAGRLLDNMLRALGMERGKNVYIANVLKCRPPQNRPPQPDEVDACRPYLDRQIELIKPKLIVALGKSAATTLLKIDATIASLRSRVHRYQGVPLIVTYHPAYLLRSLPDKAKAWEDLCLARATLREQSSADRL